jgi:hypothetical protein
MLKPVNCLAINARKRPASNKSRLHKKRPRKEAVFLFNQAWFPIPPEALGSQYYLMDPGYFPQHPL